MNIYIKFYSKKCHLHDEEKKEYVENLLKKVQITNGKLVQYNYNYYVFESKRNEVDINFDFKNLY